MKGITIIVVVLGLVSMALASCSVQVTAVARVGATWPVSNGGGIAGIYDIIAHNIGDQTSTRVYFKVVLPSGVDIIQWWQFSRLPPTFEDLPDNFGPGQTYGSGGFVVQQLAGTNFPVITLSNNYTVC